MAQPCTIHYQQKCSGKITAYVTWKIQIFTVMKCLCIFSCFHLFFFYQSFLSSTLTTQRTAEEGRGPSFIPLFHFQSLTSIKTFAILHMRWLTHIFNRTTCIYQTATQWDLPPYRIAIWLIDDVMLIFVCLLVDLILGFAAAIWHEKLVDLNLHQLSSLYYKRID